LPKPTKDNAFSKSSSFPSGSSSSPNVWISLKRVRDLPLDSSVEPI
jgi:hypothetical protein